MDAFDKNHSTSAFVDDVRLKDSFPRLSFKPDLYLPPLLDGTAKRSDYLIPLHASRLAFVSIVRQEVDPSKLNRELDLPYELRLSDFEGAMQDVYDFFFDVNSFLRGKGLDRLDDMLRPANMSGVLTDMLTAALAKHSRILVPNQHFNGHPDLVVKGVYPNNAVPAGEKGVEVKNTRKRGGAVDTHGARDQWLCVFVYQVDNTTEPADDREAMTFTEVYLGYVTVGDFRKNPRGELGTRTATLHAEGIKKLRESWIYKL